MRMDLGLPIKANAYKSALRVRERKIIKGINEAIEKGRLSYSIRANYVNDSLKKRLEDYGYKITKKMNHRHDYIYEISWGPEEKEEE